MFFSVRQGNGTESSEFQKFLYINRRMPSSCDGIPTFRIRINHLFGFSFQFSPLLLSKLKGAIVFTRLSLAKQQAFSWFKWFLFMSAPHQLLTSMYTCFFALAFRRTGRYEALSCSFPVIHNSVAMTYHQVVANKSTELQHSMAFRWNANEVRAWSKLTAKTFRKTNRIPIISGHLIGRVMLSGCNERWNLIRNIAGNGFFTAVI